MVRRGAAAVGVYTARSVGVYKVYMYTPTLPLPRGM